MYRTIWVVLYFMVFFALACQRLENPISGQPPAIVDTSFDRTIGIVVNKYLYPTIKSAIDRYARDLSEIEAKKVWIEGQTFDKNSSITDLHDSLAAHYYGGNLEGEASPILHAITGAAFFTKAMFSRTAPVLCFPL